MIYNARYENIQMLLYLNIFSIESVQVILFTIQAIRYNIHK